MSRKENHSKKKKSGFWTICGSDSRTIDSDSSESDKDSGQTIQPQPLEGKEFKFDFLF